MSASAGSGLRRLGRAVWARVQPWGLYVTAVLTTIAGVVALVTAAEAPQGSAPSLEAPFAVAGLGLVLAALLIVLRVRSELIEIILGGLAGSAFGVCLAEMSAQAATIPDHYKSVWVPAVLAGLLVLFLAFRTDPAG